MTDREILTRAAAIVAGFGWTGVASRLSDGLRCLPADVDQRDAEIAWLREALEVFADPDNWLASIQWKDEQRTDPADFARKALDGP